MQTTSSSSSCCSCCSRLVGRTWVVCSTGSGRFRTHPCSFRQLVVGCWSRARHVTSRHGRYGVTQDTGQVAARRSPIRVVLAPAQALRRIEGAVSNRRIFILLLLVYSNWISLLLLSLLLLSFSVFLSLFILLFVIVLSSNMILIFFSFFFLFLRMRWVIMVCSIRIVLKRATPGARARGEAPLQDQ